MQPSDAEVGWFKNIQHVSFNILMFISLHDGALDAEDETDIQETKFYRPPARLNCSQCNHWLVDNWFNLIKPRKTEDLFQDNTHYKPKLELLENCCQQLN